MSIRLLIAASLTIGNGLSSPASAQTVRPPFSEAVRVDDMLLLSGQIGIVPGQSRPVEGGIAAETRQAMTNIGATLARNGLGFGDVVRCLVMMTDLDRWDDFNAAYVSFFGNARLPARSTLGANALALGANVEIECTAHFPAAAPRAVAAGGALGPYSQAVAANGLLFISGVIPFDPVAKRFAAPDITSQMGRALANLDVVLAASGARRQDIVRTTLYLRNASDKLLADAAYAAWFGGVTLPARTTVPGFDWGRDDLLVEIDAIAVAPGADK
jgi:2-iminobutanoate/2-iminopropanoate deaminase